MQSVINQADLISKILGLQQIDYSKTYRWLSFCKFKKCGDGTLVYNNLTKEMLLLYDNEMDIVNNYFDFDSFIIDYLIKHWFLVLNDNDDLILNKQVNTIAKNVLSKKGLNFANIFTTTACNARCFYCFEAGIKPKTMNLETANATADYLINNCLNKRIDLQWFGGEPLCNTKAIDCICEKLKNNRIQYSSVIISNGYLFDEELILKAKRLWNVRYVQITLDGTKDVYNKVKNYVNAIDNPFEKVLQNIEILLKNEIKVNVRLNMDLYNEMDLYDLVNILYKRFSKYKNFNIFLSLIYEDEGFSPINHSENERKKLENKFFEFLEHLYSLNIFRFKFLKPSVKIGRCAADSLNSVQISPEGKLGNCEHYPDSDFYGSVFTNDSRQIWTNYIDRTSICDDCPLIPSCFILKKCNTKQCSEFRKKRLLIFLDNDMIYSYNYQKEHGKIKEINDV